MEWETTFFGQEPRWSSEPDVKIVEQLAHMHLSAAVGQMERCQASFFAAGAFNKLYLIDSSNKGKFLMRVSMPIYPTYKTRSEVSTMLWIRQETKIPVPGIIAFDDSGDNLLGFEWILMEMMPGTSLYQRWRTMPLEAKHSLVRKIAGYQAELSKSENKWQGIGNIYRSHQTANSPDVTAQIVQHDGKHLFEVGRMVALEFFWGDRIDKVTQRGPFRNSLEWFKTRLELIVSEQQSILRESVNEDEKEGADCTLELAEQLSALLPETFAFQTDEAEPTTLWHNDLSQSNILVNDANEITAILDWECVSLVPTWVPTKVPEFLSGRIRRRFPVREGYGDDSNEKDDIGTDPDDVDEWQLNNEGKTVIYWEHLLEYEQTMLRSVYFAEMERLSPGFATHRMASMVKSNLEYAVNYCGSALAQRNIRRWLDDPQKGEPRWDLWQPESNEME